MVITKGKDSIEINDFVLRGRKGAQVLDRVSVYLELQRKSEGINFENLAGAESSLTPAQQTALSLFKKNPDAMEALETYARVKQAAEQEQDETRKMELESELKGLESKLSLVGLNLMMSADAEPVTSEEFVQKLNGNAALTDAAFDIVDMFLEAKGIEKTLADNFTKHNVFELIVGITQEAENRMDPTPFVNTLSTSSK